MNSLRGHLLTAAPNLGDPNFSQTVVFMIEHDENGAFGLVLNRPTETTVGEVWRDLPGTPADESVLIHLGGPVTGPLIALHSDPLRSEHEVLPNLHIASNKNNVEPVVCSGTARYKLFKDYSGWGPGQLDAEMEAGGWLTLQAREEHIYSDNSELWKLVAEEIGKGIMFPNANKQGPADPSLN